VEREGIEKVMGKGRGRSGRNGKREGRAGGAFRQIKI